MLDRIGDKWSLLIVRDLFAGKSHYGELAQSPERIASNILADRLERLQANGLIETTPSTQRAGSSAYGLTKRGRELLPVLKAISAWGLANIAGTQARIAIPTPAPTPTPTRRRGR
ncbi:MAG: helix-turn-helix domain-containing protein [Phycisphaerae bacterium]|nr:helix-turn-helix domain-containing protein [Phycisphaerae bacterium]